MFVRKVIFTIATAVVVLAGECVAQKETPPVRFSSRTELVLVPVLARGKDGKAVMDLKQEDFVVLDNDKAQPLTSFDPPQLERAQMQVAATASAQAEFTNVGQEAPRSLTIIAMDPGNTTFGDMHFARDAVLRFLNSAIESNTRIAVISLSSGSFTVIHDFSQDPAVLRKAIAKARAESNLEPLAIGNMPLPELQPCQSCVDKTDAAIQATMVLVGKRDNTMSDMTADSMRAVAKAFGPLPGRKTLVWVTDAFPLLQDKPVLASAGVSAELGRGTPKAIWESAFHSLNDASIAVYPVHAAGLVAFVKLGCRHCVTDPEVQEHNDRLDAMTWVANETGGLTAFNSNDILHSIERAAADSSTAYMLSYRLPANARNGWHHLQVKVNRPGVHVVTRNGFFAGHQGVFDEERELAMALQSPFPYTALPLTVRWAGVRSGSSGKSVATFQFAVSAGALAVDANDKNHANFELRTLARTVEMDTAGEVKRDFDAHLTPEGLAKFTTTGFNYEGQLELAPGDYDVRFVVRDKLSGRIGAVSAPLRVQ